MISSFLLYFVKLDILCFGLCIQFILEMLDPAILQVVFVKFPFNVLVLET
jgi:hypothetical protein